MQSVVYINMSIIVHTITAVVVCNVFAVMVPAGHDVVYNVMQCNYIVVVPCCGVQICNAV